MVAGDVRVSLPFPNGQPLVLTLQQLAILNAKFDASKMWHAWHTIHKVGDLYDGE
jgi:hypothetical protein